MKTYEDYEESGLFDDDQMKQIRFGFDDGLTMEQVAVYAMPHFDWGQMQQIRWGFEAGLTMEQVETYAKPEFDDKQMQQIRWGFEAENKKVK